VLRAPNIQSSAVAEMVPPYAAGMLAE